MSTIKFTEEEDGALKSFEGPLKWKREKKQMMGMFTKVVWIDVELKLSKTFLAWAGDGIAADVLDIRGAKVRPLVGSSFAVVSSRLTLELLAASAADAAAWVAVLGEVAEFKKARAPAGLEPSPATVDALEATIEATPWSPLL